MDWKPEVTQCCGFESRLRQKVHDCCPLLQVCALGWVKCREHVSLLIILCIIVYVTNKAHPSLICNLYIFEDNWWQAIDNPTRSPVVDVTETSQFSELFVIYRNLNRSTVLTAGHWHNFTFEHFTRIGCCFKKAFSNSRIPNMTINR